MPLAGGGQPQQGNDQVQHKRDQEYLEGPPRDKRMPVASKTGTLQPSSTVFLSEQDAYEAETAKSVGAEIWDLRPDFESQTEHKLAGWPEVHDTTSRRPVCLFVS